MRAIEKRLRERVKELEAERDALKKDREEFRAHFIQRFKWWIELLGSQSKPNLAWLVENDAIWLRRFERWYW